MKVEQLSLFKDLLDQSDQWGRNDSHLERGHGVWSIATDYTRRRNDGWRETISLIVIYDDERFCFDKTGKYWIVQCQHWLSRSEDEVSGWGNSRRNERILKTRYFSRKRNYATRAMVIEATERILEMFNKRKVAFKDEN